MKRRLFTTTHGYERYAERVAREPWNVRAELEADFAGARTCDKLERQMHVESCGNYATSNAACFYNPETETVFICEAVDARTFRLITCFVSRFARRSERCA